MTGEPVRSRDYVGGMSLEVPDQVRRTALADGNESWLHELPGVVDSLAREWSLVIGSGIAGGHAALVVEVTLADGTPAVLKIGVPGRDIGPEAIALRLANGEGCAKLWGEDPDRQALLLERLGAPMHDTLADPASRHNLLCDVALRLWRPIGPDAGLPTGATLAEQYADRLPELWEQAGRPCSPAVGKQMSDGYRRRSSRTHGTATGGLRRRQRVRREKNPQPSVAGYGLPPPRRVVAGAIRRVRVRSDAGRGRRRRCSPVPTRVRGRPAGRSRWRGCGPGGPAPAGPRRRG